MTIETAISRQARNGSQPFTVVDGIAVIEIAGTLVHRGAWIGQSSGLTSYEGIAAQLQAALADPAIRGIALDIDSFGGEVAGAFDLADRIRMARTQKPVQAFVADHALSAAYALASQADRIILPRTGAVGSIGVVAMHSDMSGALDQKGIAVTLIHSGAHTASAASIWMPRRAACAQTCATSAASARMASGDMAAAAVCGGALAAGGAGSGGVLAAGAAGRCA